MGAAADSRRRSRRRPEPEGVGGADGDRSLFSVPQLKADQARLHRPVVLAAEDRIGAEGDAVGRLAEPDRLAAADRAPDAIAAYGIGGMELTGGKDNGHGSRPLGVGAGAA